MPAVAETSDEGLEEDEEEEEEEEGTQGEVDVGKSKDSSIDGVHVGTEKAIDPNWDEAAWSAEQEVARYAC